MPKKVKTASQIEDLAHLEDDSTEDLLQDLVVAVKGMAGTKLIDGYIDEEYNPQLAGQKGMEMYDRMRRSDAQVSAVLLAMELPIRNAFWDIEPAKNEDDEVTPEYQEQADFITENLFERMQDGWDAKLREILTMLAFGFSIFEKVYISDGEKVYLDKLGFRKQPTIVRWTTSARLPGITQLLPTPSPSGEFEVSIPGYQLLLFSFRKEGDNYQGISVLRSAYKNYFIKDKLYKFDAVKHERQGVGIPIIYIPKNANKAQKTVAANIVKNIRATEQTGIVMPGSKADGWEFEFADLKAGSQSDLWESIKHHNREIAKNVLAQFLELGDTGSGSFSLGADQSDIFISSLTSIATQICEVVNKHLIRELVDMNFDTDAYPKLRVQKITKTDTEKLANTIATLVGGGIINTDEPIEDYMRELMGLPAREMNEMTEEEDDGEDGDEGMPEDDGADVVSELETLAKTDGADAEEEFNDLMETVLEFAESAIFRAPMTDETKKKISEALTKNKNKNLVTQVNQGKQAIGETSAAISKAREEVANLKAELAKIPKGPAGKAARQKIAAKAKTMLQGVKELQGKKKGMAKTVQEAKKELKARKAALSAEIKGIRESVKAGRTGAKEAVAGLQSKVTANRAESSKLREELKKLPKGDPRRDAINTTLEGISKENMDIKTAQAGIRTSAKVIGDTAKTTIDKKKTDSGLYHEHDDHCDGGSELPSVFSDEFFSDMSKAFTNDRVTALIRGAKDDTSRNTIRRLGFRFNEFEDKAARPLTFAEKKVNFTALIAAMDGYTKLIENKLEELTGKQKEDLLKQVAKAVEANDIKAVGEIKAKYTGEMSKALEDIMKDVFEIGKKSAASEMAVNVLATTAEIKAGIKVQAQAIVDKVTAEMENGIKTAVTQTVQKNGGSVTNTGTTEAVAAASANLDKALEGAKATLTSLGVTGTINMGRAFVFERFPEKVYAFQFSAILDAKTTDTCRSLDGRIVKPGSSEFYDYSPPRHYRCRSIWVEILQDEVFKPAIDGIPASIPKNPTIDTFKDLQSPIILQNSPAVKVVRKELEERKQKLADLEVTGQFPNRQEAHRKRIAELEASLKGIKTEGDSEFFEGAKKALSQYGVEFQ